MQRFRDEETTTASPLYSGESVRQVLARASEIESEVEQEMMTEAQVESLGREIGLSPNAVRRALGEATGSVTTGTTIAVTRSVLTQEQVRQAYVPLLLSLLLCLPATNLACLLVHTSPMNSDNVVVHLVILGSLFLTARAGWLVKRRRMSAVGALFVPMMFIFAYIATVSPQSWDYREGSFALILGFIGFVLFVGGATARKWWDHLPRNSDR